jgi:Mlc titration factor MtfA (ptsG expression regulator)
MWGWLQRLATATRRRPTDIPDALWQATLAHYPFLDERVQPEQQRLRELCGHFLAEKEFHGAQGLVITDAMALAIAAQACLPVLQFGPGREPLAWYDDFVGIVVHPDEVVARREVVDDDGVVHHYDEVLAGEAMQAGPVMLSWQDVSAASPDSGYSVVIHEFVHKLDQRDGAADGCPPLPAGFLGATSARQARAHWLATLQACYDGFREQVIKAERFGAAPPWLDPYGAEAIDEFFAVASEAYFINRARFTQDFPALLPLFNAFYQRPASHGR